MLHSVPAWAVLGASRSRMTQVTPPLHNQHWLSACFWVKFKLLVINFKALHRMCSRYLSSRLIPLGLAHPIHTGRGGKLQALSAKEFWPVRSKRRAWKPSSARWIGALTGGASHCRWLMNWDAIPPPPLHILFPPPSPFFNYIFSGLGFLFFMF